MEKIYQVTFNGENKNLLCSRGVMISAENLDESNLIFNFGVTHIKIYAPKDSVFFLNKKPYPIKIDDSGYFELNTNNNIWISNIRSDFNTANDYQNIAIELYYQ